MPIATKEISINKKVSVGGSNPFFLIAGPCVIESKDHAYNLAIEIKQTCEKLQISFIFKASYDKANRSSISSYRGPGLKEGLEILRTIKEELDIPVLSDVHETYQIDEAAKTLDIIQIPALLSRQTDLIIGAAKTQKPLNLKKGQFSSPYEMKNAVEKAVSQGNENIILTERGTFFGYNNLVFDIRSIPIMKNWGFPVVIDASHSVQKPGGEGTFSGGEAGFIPYIAKAGTSVGADGVFLEVHENPPKARSDSRNSLKLNELHNLLLSLQELKKAADINSNPHWGIIKNDD
ncbi:MAG: 3-deoxy-8-phosphooctulonate synthase [Candidatus Aminicenantes bacterium]|nr:MAG: 3-deoxy-8-phosphooctulonate synthase [Candidatus Aminicenantes bacterium]